MGKDQNEPEHKSGAISKFLVNAPVGRILIFLGFPLALLFIAFWETSHEPPIFDAQVHYNEESWDKVSAKAILNTARKFNVPWLLVGSTPNEGTWK